MTAAVQIAAQLVVEDNYGLRDLLQIHGIPTNVVEAHLAKHRQILAHEKSSSIASVRSSKSPLPERARPARSPRTVTNPTHKLVSAEVQKRLLIDTNEHLEATTISIMQSAGRNTHQTPQDIRQFYDPSVSRDRALPAIRSVAEPSPASSHDSAVRESPNHPTLTSYDPATKDDNPMLSDDELYTSQEARKRRRLESLQLPGIKSTTCPETPGRMQTVPTDETSCEEAAWIIARMRGHQDHELLWPELGCSEVKRCWIKNLKIFEMTYDCSGSGDS